MRFTPLFASTMSGSLGGLTAARGPRGHRLYGRRKKIRSDSPFQRAARQAFAWTKQAWTEEASAEDRLFWERHGSSLHVADRLGVARPLGGREAYTAFDLPFLYFTALGANAGFTPFPSGRPPLGFAPPPLMTNSSLTVSGGGTVVSFDADLENLDQFAGFPTLYFYASRPSNRPDSNCRKGYIFAGESIGGNQVKQFFNFGAFGGLNWLDKYGPAVLGQWVGMKVVYYTGDLQFGRPYEFGPIQLQP